MDARGGRIEERALQDQRHPLDDPASLIRQTTPDELDKLMTDGTIAGGMIPKVNCCVDALKAGVKKAHIVDGRVEHAILLEIFTDVGVGTEIQG